MNPDVVSSGLNTYLSVSKVIEDGGKFLGAGILTLGDDGWVGVPPDYGEPMEPHVSLLHVGLTQARVEAVDLTSRPRQGTLQGSIIRTQPATQVHEANKLIFQVRATGMCGQLC